LSYFNDGWLIANGAKSVSQLSTISITQGSVWISSGGLLTPQADGTALAAPAYSGGGAACTATNVVKEVIYTLTYVP